MSNIAADQAMLDAIKDEFSGVDPSSACAIEAQDLERLIALAEEALSARGRTSVAVEDMRALLRQPQIAASKPIRCGVRAY